jgi:hypothetical protein
MELCLNGMVKCGFKRDGIVFLESWHYMNKRGYLRHLYFRKFYGQGI